MSSRFSQGQAEDRLEAGWGQAVDRLGQDGNRLGAGWDRLGIGLLSPRGTEELWLGGPDSGWQGSSAICPYDCINPGHIWGDSGEDCRGLCVTTSIRYNTMGHPSTQ